MLSVIDIIEWLRRVVSVGLAWSKKFVDWLIDWLNILKSENNIKIFSGVDGKVSQSEHFLSWKFILSISWVN